MFKMMHRPRTFSHSSTAPLPYNSGVGVEGDRHARYQQFFQSRTPNAEFLAAPPIPTSKMQRSPFAPLLSLLTAVAPSLSISSHMVVFCTLCALWYTSSTITNMSSKSIMNAFPYPLTLTFIQFFFVAAWCAIAASVSKVSGKGIMGNRGGLRWPTREVLMTTGPLTGFQVLGHVFGSVATGRVPVHTVHTVKALSPLFTVLAYRTIFNIKYTPATYASLFPLTLGVMLACSFQLSVNLVGLSCALGSTLVFVTQNIFSKKLLTHDEPLHPDQRKKLDKLNLMFYSSGMAFLVMFPLWIRYEGYALLTNGRIEGKEVGVTTGTLQLRFWANGTAHFAQNLLAFTLLGTTSPVTYSIASLIKRIFVITISILWFSQPTSTIQGVGIVLTFVGLWMYDRSKVRKDLGRGERRVEDAVMGEQAGLPMVMGDGFSLPFFVTTTGRFRSAVGHPAAGPARTQRRYEGRTRCGEHQSDPLNRLTLHSPTRPPRTEVYITSKLALYPRTDPDIPSDEAIHLELADQLALEDITQWHPQLPPHPSRQATRQRRSPSRTPICFWEVE
ncbi:hypothetical protein G7K_0506-t2 [Saitoella complicata NRRL Y-17804]|uniref:Sugar phosphate transporter domain-containing protein n=1 Tax=Saitoella complicata (strain BCRC 22490 / CBS 7301 / JCM 7358 / NBRC 10748 / NRRL Y-17804) TaxID=698492 RepID=A0A0E9N8Z1_SAICN|nr:hypothetical protein G7K_0506-t2 [Saitoella complicata NRRL Y-17804]